MKRLSEHLKEPSKRSRRDKITERGELMEYFMKKLNKGRVRDGYSALTMGRMARLLLAAPTKDLYYLKTICDEAKDFSKKFWWEINPKKHARPEDGREKEK